MKTPSNVLGTLADKRYKLRERRLAAAEKVKELKQQEAELEAEIFAALAANNLTSGSGRTAKVSVSRTLVPVIKDWDSYFAFAKRKGNQDLLNHSVNSVAWRERFQADKPVPGVEPFERISLSVTKITTRK